MEKNIKGKKIRQDINLSKYQIFASSKNKEAIRVIPTKQGNIEICGIAKYGTLKIFDYKTLLALTQIWEDKGKPLHPIKFSLYELMENLKSLKGGAQYENIKNSLLRLSAVPIIWRKSYFDKKKGHEMEELRSFHILDELVIRGKKNSGEANTRFKFNKHILRNLKNNHTKPVYKETILNFESDIAVLLYRHIDYALYKHKTQTITLTSLCFQLGIKWYKYKSKRLEKIENAINEVSGALLSSGEKIHIDVIETSDKKDYKCIFFKKPAILEKKKDEITKEQLDELDELVIIFNKKTIRGRICNNDLFKIMRKFECSYEKMKDILNRISFNAKYAPIETLIAILNGKYILLSRDKPSPPPALPELTIKEREERDFIAKEQENIKKLDNLFENMSFLEQKLITQKATNQLKQKGIDENVPGYNIRLMQTRRLLLSKERD